MSSDKLYHYKAWVTSIYDGDSCWVDMDLGMGMTRKSVKLRWYAIDTPELKRDTREAGLAARDRVAEVIEGEELMIRTYLDRRGRDRTGKFGRLLAVVHAPQGRRWINVNRLLLREGHALVRTYGDPVPDWAEGYPRHPSESKAA